MRTHILLAVAACIFGLASASRAQDPFGTSPDPFGSAPDPFGSAPDPFGSAAAVTDPSGTPAAEPAAAADQETDPFVLSIRDSNPTTPTALARAIRNLANIGRADEARKYMQQLLDASPTQETLADLQREFGSALFMRLARDARFAPEGQALGAAVLDAASATARDPARLSELISRLSDSSVGVRSAALAELRRGGSASAAALIGALGDRDRKAEHAAIRAALVSLKSVAQDPLESALESPDAALQTQALVVLSKMDARDAAPYCLRPYFASAEDATLRRAARIALLRLLDNVPNQQDAERYLARQANAYLDGKLAGRPNHEGLVPLWTWDPQQRAPVQNYYPSAIASRMVATRLASDLYAIAPDNIDHQRLYLTTLLASANRAQQSPQSLPQEPGSAYAAAVALGPEALADALPYALESDQVAAAAGMIEVLGDIGDRRLLQSRGGLPSPLADALRHPDRRVRFAAVEAVMKLDPKEPFAGSSYLPESLGFFASSTGARRALIVHPRTDQAQTLVGILNELGFEGDTATTGQRASSLVREQADYEFILVSDAVDNPSARELLQQLRRDPHSARLPIGLMARDESFERMSQLASDDPLVEAFPRPHDATTLALVVQRLLGRADDDISGQEERLHQARTSLAHLARLSEESGHYPFYDLLRQQPAVEQALGHDALAEVAARVLGYFGSPTAQQNLVDVASQNSRALPHRQAAAQAFDVAVKRRGILLSQDEILRQYDRYNQSASMDRETQQVLGAILDAIEAPAQAKSEGVSVSSPAGD